MKYRRILSLFVFFVIILFLNADASLADVSPTATPAPVSIQASPSEPPAEIQQMIDIALQEWEKLGGRAIPKSNKYTKWVNDSAWGWCAGFTSWCARQAGIPMRSLSAILKSPEGESEPVCSCSAVSPGKQLRAFQHMHRTTMIPRKGYFAIYGDRTNYTAHIGLICDVFLKSDGKYRITTVEGNMKSTVRMFIADYEPVDVYFEQNHKPSVSNLTAVPSEEQEEETRMKSYRLRVSDTDGSDWYITCFLMTWLPEDDFTVVEEDLT